MLAPLIGDTVGIVHEALAAGQHVLLEGAQATFLDLDHGTYPFVTSSNPVGRRGVRRGRASGPGTSTVGDRHRQGLRHPGGVRSVPDRAARRARRPPGRAGPRVRHQHRPAAPHRVVRRGHDPPGRAAQLAHRRSPSPSSTCSTPSTPCKVCVAYECDGERYDHMPYHQSVLHKVTPVYEELPGWQTDTLGGHRAAPAAGGGQGLRAVPRRSGRRADHAGRGRPGPGAVRQRSRRRAGAACGSAWSARAAASTPWPAPSAAPPTVVVTARATRAWPPRSGVTCVARSARGGRRRPVRDRARGSRWSTGWPTGCGPPGRLVFGPGADGARLEGSKAWMKEVLVARRRADGRLRDLRRRSSRPSTSCAASVPGPYVVKTDGLAAGKGVLVTDDVGRRRSTTSGPSSRAPSFGAAGRTGRDRGGPDRPGASRCMAVCDGDRAVRPGSGPGLQARRRR